MYVVLAPPLVVKQFVMACLYNVIQEVVAIGFAKVLSFIWVPPR